MMQRWTLPLCFFLAALAIPAPVQAVLNCTVSTVWGNGTGGTLRYTSVSSNRPITLTIFGRIPPGQDISTGTYSDTIVVTVDF